MAAAQRIAHFGSWELDLANTADVGASALSWSDEMHRIAGFEPGSVQVTNDLFFKLVPPEEHEAIRSAVAEALRGGRPYNLIHRMIRPSGEVRIVQEVAEVVRDEKTARPLKMVGTAHDITERRKADEALLRSERELRELTRELQLERERLVAAQRVARIGSWETDLATMQVIWSEETHRIFETTPQTFHPTHAAFLEFVHPEDRRKVDDAFMASLTSTGSHVLEHRIVMKDGRVKVVEERWQAEQDAEGRPVRAYGTCQDISERKQAGARLLESEARYRALFDRSLDAVYVNDLTGRFVDANPAALKLLGYEREDIPSLTYASLVTSEEDMLRAHLAMQTQLTLGVSEGLMEFKLKRKDGSIIWVELASSPVFENGRPVALQGIARDITGRKRAEEEIRRTTTLLQAVTDGTPDAVFVKDLEGCYLMFNEGAARLVGKSVNEVLGRDDSTLFDEDSARIIRESDLKVIKSGMVQTLEETLTAAGVRRTYLATKAPYRDAQGNIIGVIGISRDITERKRHERHLMVLSRLGRELNTALSPRAAAEIITRFADELFGWDSATLDLYSPETGLIKAVLSVDLVDGRRTECPPAYDDVPPSPRARKTIEEGAQLILKASIDEPDNEGIPFGDCQRLSASIMFVPIRDAQRPIGVLSIQSYELNAYTGEDLNLLQLLADYCGGALRRIQTEALRRESDERFLLLSRATHDSIWDYDRVSGKLWWNEGFALNFGYEQGRIKPSYEMWADCIHPEDRDRVLAHVERAIAEGQQNYTNEYRFRRADGTYAYVLDRGHIICDDSRRPIRMVGGITDLSEHKAAEEKLREQAALLDAAHEAIVVKDLDDRVIYWNKGAERTYGWTAEEALGQRAVDLLHANRERSGDALRQLMERGEWQGELPLKHKSGRVLDVDVKWTLVRDEAGGPKSILSISSDITERKKLEQQFLRAQRMESIGTLAGGIAHDLNNVLAPILMSLQMLREDSRDEATRALIDTLQQSAQRGADLVKQVLGFARGVQGQRVPVNIVHLLRDLMTVMRDTFPKSITIQWRPPQGLWTVTGDPTQIHQVFLNLCVNARDAMQDGGRLTIYTENVEVDQTYAAMNPEFRPGSFVMTCVEDPGPGIPPAIQTKIFEPFFTTKELGKGTGLGLSAALAIVKSHGGFINLYSEPDKGTKFKVYLPATNAPDEAGRIETSQTKLPAGSGELVLAVDDEESIRAIVKSTLERFGYRVLLARHGADAVSQYVRHQRDIAVVLTDMAMPIMDGPALILALKAINPEVRIIGSSGLASHSGVAKAVGAGVKHFIPKPYTAETMLKTLSEALKSPP